MGSPGQYDGRVEVVLINYKRPSNIPDLLEALRGQTARCQITLINAAPSQEFSLDQEILQSVDRLFTWSHEFGPYNRYVPIAAFSHEYTYFHDDDMLPGNRVIEHFIDAADSLGAFGVLGQTGRNVTADGVYVPRAIRRSDEVTPVDIVVRGYFVQTKNLPAVIQLRHKLGLDPNVDLEDDLLLCAAMNLVQGLTNYLTPIDLDNETWMNKSRLRGDFARFKRSVHFEDRTEFCKRAIGLGWVPLSLGRQSSRRAQQTSSWTSANGERQMSSPDVPTTPESLSAEMPVEQSELQHLELRSNTSLNRNEKRRAFSVNDYWLKRGQTYIQEERLYTEPYRHQEEFIIGALLATEFPIRRILEIGCGFGRITKLLAKSFPEADITAIDLSPDQLQNAAEYCADYAERIQFAEYDIYSDLPLPAPNFDVAIAIEVFMHHPYEKIRQLIEHLSNASPTIVNYDWSEEWEGNVAKHVWVHDYAKIYEDLGLECKVITEDQKFRGQQQKLFIASSSSQKRSKTAQEFALPDSDIRISAENRTESADAAPQQPSGARVANAIGPNGSKLSMSRIESRIPSDHARQATLEFYLETYLDLEEKFDILDLGCGTGSSFDKISSRLSDFTWTGVDIADSSEVRSRTRSDCRFETFDGVNLPFESDSFDVVLSIQVFEHVRHPEPLLKEVYRVLRPGGIFLGSVSQLEPFHSNSLWNFTYYGFANIAFDAGLSLRELRPGIDGITLIVRNILNHGFRQRVGLFAPFFEGRSPLNEFFSSTLGQDDANISKLNRMMLRYCGHFCFVFERPAG